MVAPHISQPAVILPSAWGRRRIASGPTPQNGQCLSFGSPRCVLIDQPRRLVPSLVLGTYSPPALKL